MKMLVEQMKLHFKLKYKVTEHQNGHFYIKLKKKAPAHQHLCKNYICAASRNTRDRIMLIRAKHRTIV